MIIQKPFEQVGSEMPLIRTYSDLGMKIRQVETGYVYDDAVDVSPCRYTYEETDEPIEVMEDADSA